jgi:hypothetical protein
VVVGIKQDDSNQYFSKKGNGNIPIFDNDVRVVTGPCVNLNNLSLKRVKRKNVQLVRKSRG